MAGESPAPGSPLPGLVSGSWVAAYRLEAQVGAGGMAVVFRARDERLGRVVALKVLAPGLAADAGFRERFIRESQAAAAVDDPHIIPVYEAGEADGVLFIAMRFVSGGDLRSVLAREGPMAPGRAAGFVSPVASALDAAHAAGLVHRDVKPANMLVDTRPGRPDHVYLSDFGLTKGALWSASLTAGSGHFLGTPDYAAPEQVTGQVVDGRTDQYALACVAFRLLAGVPPFGRDEPMAVLWAHVHDLPPSLITLRPDLPPAVDQVLARALAKAPENRYAGCGDFDAALRDALGLPPYSSTAIAPGRPPAGPAQPAGAWPPPAGAPARPFARAGEASTIGVPASPRPSLADTVLRSAGKRPVPRPRRRRIFAAALAAALVAVAAVLAATLGLPGISGPTGLSVATRRLAILTDPGSGGIGRAVFGRDGKLLATADGNGSTYLWDVATHTRIAALPDNLAISWAAFSPHSRTLATADAAGNIALWNVATRTNFATLADPDNRDAFSVAFSPDGKTLATADYYGRSYLWAIAERPGAGG